MKLVAGTLALALPLLAPVAARAQVYPSRPITMIVVFAAGGPTDVLARIVADHMGRTIGQRIVIENLAGAGGTTGGARGARAEPDGYTLTVGSLGTATPRRRLPGLWGGLRRDRQGGRPIARRRGEEHQGQRREHPAP
jgi:tripartite-type tricarboxylate transporter receptor subunit TctC